MSNWIPVTERLPDKNCEVLMTVLFAHGAGPGHIAAGYYTTNPVDDWSFPITSYDFSGPGFYIDVDHDRWEVLDHDEVLAWMPMPEPYQKED